MKDWKTGAEPPPLMQDDCRALSVWFSSRLGARYLLACAFVLAGCDTMPKVVNVPVPVPCLDAKDLPQRPPLVTDADLRAAKASNGARWIGMKNYQDQSLPYIADLERVAKACSR